MIKIHAYNNMKTSIQRVNYNVSTTMCQLQRVHYNVSTTTCPLQRVNYNVSTTTCQLQRADGAVDHIATLLTTRTPARTHACTYARMHLCTYARAHKNHIWAELFFIMINRVSN